MNVIPSVLASAACVSLVGPAIAHAAPVAAVPEWVVNANGNAFGFFIGDLGGDILIGLKDPDNGNTIPLQIRRSAGNLYFEGNEPRVFYTLDDCAGTVYVNDPDDSNVRARTVLLGTTYGVGSDPNNGGNLTIFRSTDVAPTTPTIESLYINGSCNNSGVLFGTVVPADAVIDITTDYPAPYTME